MIVLEKFVLKDVLPQDELQAWRDGIDKVGVDKCPIEVQQFIDALARKLPDFGRIGQDESVISGEELLLAGLKTYNGVTIDFWSLYKLPVPRLTAIDNRASMYRIYHRKGKSGLIDWCKAAVKGHEQARLIEILTVEVFKQERPEFTRIMNDIEKSKKADSL